MALRYPKSPKAATVMAKGQERGWWWWSNFCWDKIADFSLAHRNKWLDSMSSCITIPPSWVNNTYLATVNSLCSYKTLHLCTGRKGGRNNLHRLSDKIRRCGYEQGTFSWKSRWSADLTAGITEAHLTRSHQLHCCGHAMHGSLFSLQPEVIWKRWTSQPWEFKRLVRSWADGLGSCRRCGLDGGSMEWALRSQSLLLFIPRWPATMHAVTSLWCWWTPTAWNKKPKYTFPSISCLGYGVVP